MIKYIPELTSVVAEEIPGRISLAVEISNCRGNCPGCHSPFLKEDIGSELTPEIISALYADNYGVNCFLFLGEGRDPRALMALAHHARNLGLQVALYSGRPDVEDTYWEVFDYIKTGPYIQELGPLNSPTTNQRLYEAVADAPAPGDAIIRGGRAFADITARFWRKGIDPLRNTSPDE